MTSENAGRETSGEAVSMFWDDLAAHLRDAECFSALFEFDPLEVLRAWAALEENSPHRVVDAYAGAIRDPEDWVAYGPGLAELLHDRELPDKAESLLRRLVEQARRSGDAHILSGALADLVRTSAGSDVRSSSQELLRLSREIGDSEALVEALCSEAWSRWLDGLLDDDPTGGIDSRRMLQEQRRICRDHGLTRGLAHWADAAAWILYCDGYPAPMPRLFAREEQLCRECDDLRLLCGCLLQRARVLRARPETAADAWAKMEEAEGIARELGLAEMLAAALMDKGVTALLEGDEARALGILTIVRSRPAAGEPDTSLETALRQALDFPDHPCPRTRGESRLEFAEMAERVARQLGDARAVQWALGHVACELEDADPGAALAACRKREAICHDLGIAENLQEALEVKAALLLRLRRPLDAVSALSEEVQVCVEAGLDWHLGSARKAQLAALRAALRECGDAEAALALQEEVALVCGWLGDRTGAAKAARDRVRLLRQLHRYPGEALPTDPAQLSLEV